jgi:hypothetical protein
MGTPRVQRSTIRLVLALYSSKKHSTTASRHPDSVAPQTDITTSKAIDLIKTFTTTIKVVVVSIVIGRLLPNSGRLPPLTIITRFDRVTLRHLLPIATTSASIPPHGRWNLQTLRGFDIRAVVAALLPVSMPIQKQLVHLLPSEPEQQHQHQHQRRRRPFQSKLQERQQCNFRMWSNVHRNYRLNTECGARTILGDVLRFRRIGIWN